MRPGLPAAPFLYPLTDPVQGGAGSGELAERLFRAGVRIVQLRDKSGSDGALLPEVRKAMAAARDMGALLVVNDRVDLALVAGAHGIHLGDDDLPVSEVRRLVGADMVLGISTHSLEEALRAAEGPVDYIALGPIYASSTKRGRPPLGPESLQALRRRVGTCVVAIGGIDAARFAEVVQAGADGVAVVSAAMREGRLERNAADLLARLGRGR